MGTVHRLHVGSPMMRRVGARAARDAHRGELYRIGFGRVGKALVAGTLAATVAVAIALVDGESSMAPRSVAEPDDPIVLDRVVVTIPAARFDALRAQSLRITLARSSPSTTP